MRRGKYCNQVIRIIVSSALLLFLLYKIGLKNIIDTLFSINPNYIFWIVILLCTPYFFGTLNVFIISRKINPRVRFYPFLKDFSISQSMGMILPGKIGDAFLILFMKKHKINMGIATAIFLIDKAISFIVIGFFALFGLHLFFTLQNTIYISIFFILIPISIIVLFKSDMIRGFIKKRILRKYASKFVGFKKSASKIYKKHKDVLFANFVLTVIRWLIAVFMIQVNFLAYNSHVDYFAVLVVCSIIALISLIPITISGIGVREVSAVYLFGIVGIEPAITISVYLLQFILKYLLVVLVFFVFLDLNTFKQLLRK